MNEIIEIPFGALEEPILHALIEDYVTREGTDYGHGDYSLDSKVNGVLNQLQNGQALIVFDPYLQQPNIVLAEEFKTMNRAGDHEQ